MSLTLEQRTNLHGIPKAAELIEITGAHALEASDRAILNLLYQHAHDSGRLGDPTACWELPITALRPSKGSSGNIRIEYHTIGLFLDFRCLRSLLPPFG